ncbi:hypothetical protein [uncultured Gammaproteobacteria bacterium]|nr:hypothetical protein [uncultured Gammaproteobacteria bacterium]
MAYTPSTQAVSQSATARWKCCTYGLNSPQNQLNLMKLAPHRHLIFNN